MNILRFIIPKSAVEFIYETSTVRQALEKMRYHHYVAIPVLTADGKYLGTVRNEDIFKYFIDNSIFDERGAESESVLDILDKDYSAPMLHNAPPSELFERVKEHNFVPVVDDRGCFIGIILRRRVLDFLKEYYEEHSSEK